MNQQLELPLWDCLRAAQTMPEAVNLGELLGQVEAAIAQVPEPEQLQVAGEALLRVAELCAMRSDVLITEWEDAYRNPIVEPGFFADVVRQTMSVDLSDLMEPAPLRKHRAKRGRSEGVEAGSIAAPVDKDVILDQLEAWELKTGTEEQPVEADAVWAIAHEESVAQWSQAISQWLEQERQPRVSFQGLHQGLRMSWVDLWLGLLLGGFELEPLGEFYGTDIWVKAPAAKGIPSQAEKV
jgi:hypothetical protein